MKSSPRQALFNTISKLKNRIDWRDLVIFAIPFVLFTLALLALWPGLYTSDSQDQYRQAQTGIVYSAHPVLHTFTIWLINKVHHSEAMLPLLQILVFSALWAAICKYLRKLYGERSFARQMVITTIICLLPVIYTYAIGAWKDVLYSYCLLALALLLFVGSNKRFNYSIFELACLALLLVLTTGYRHNGVVSAGVILLIILVAMVKYSIAKSKMLLLVGLTSAIYILTIFVPRIFLEVHNSPSNPRTSVAIFYMASFMNSGVKIDQQDQKVLYKVMPRQYWYSDYYQYSTVPIIFGGHVDKATANRYTQNLFDMMLKYDARYPTVAVDHFFEVNNMAWNVAWPLNGPYKSTPAINPMPLSENSLIDDAQMTKISFINKELRLNIDYTLDSAIMQTVFYRPALYMYLSVALGWILVIKTRKNRYWLVLVPMLSNLPAILVFGLTQDMRYLYINVLTFFFIMIIAMFEINAKRRKIETEV